MRKHLAQEDLNIMLDIHDGYSSVCGTGTLCLSSNAAQTSPQRSPNVSPGACLSRIPGPVSRSQAKPLRSPREVSVDQFPAITLSPPHLRLKPHLPFFYLLRHGILFWLHKSPRETSSRRQKCSAKPREANLCTNPSLA